MKRTMVLIAVALCLLLAGCSGFMSESSIKKITENPKAVITLTYTTTVNGATVEKVANLHYTLRFDQAPITVANFCALAEKKEGKSNFYDQTFVHHITTSTTDSSIQYFAMGAYYMGKNSSGKDAWDLKEVNYTIRGEFEANNWSKNTLKHKQGSLVMNRESGEMNNAFNSASTSFYVAMSDANSRQGNYAVFGELDGFSGSITRTLGEVKTEEIVELMGGLPYWFVADFGAKASTTGKTLADGTSITNVPNIDITVTVSVTVPQKLPGYNKIKK